MDIELGKEYSWALVFDVNRFAGFASLFTGNASWIKH